MTNADVFCKILSETTGRPEKVFRAVLAQLPPCSRGKLDEQVQDEDALLAQLRAEKAGILNWVVEGAVRAHRQIASEP